MKRKKSQNKPVPVPVMNGDCFATFVKEADSIGREVVARRQFAADVVAFLREKGLFEEWTAWHERRVSARPR